MSKFLVVSYDSDQQQWFYDFVIAESEDKAEHSVCAARPYVIAAAATELTALAKLAATLAQTPAHRIEQEFATLQDVTDRRSTAVRP